MKKKPKMHSWLLTESNSGYINESIVCTEWNYYECNGFYGRFEGRTNDSTLTSSSKLPQCTGEEHIRLRLPGIFSCLDYWLFILYYYILVYIDFPYCKKGWRYLSLFLKPLRMHCWKTPFKNEALFLSSSHVMVIAGLGLQILYWVFKYP